MTDQPVELPVPTNLLKDTQSLAKELNISWQKLLTIALNDFMRKYRHKEQLVDQLNTAYADDLDSEEMTVLQAMKATQRRMVDNEW